MKKKLCSFGVAVILAFMMSSCGGGESLAGKDSANENNNGNELYIDAKVENASEFNNVVEVKFMVYDVSVDRHVELSSSIWKNDGFKN